MNTQNQNNNHSHPIHSDKIRELSKIHKQHQNILTQNIVNKCIEKMNSEIEDHVLNGNMEYLINVREIVSEMKISHIIVNYVDVWRCLMEELNLKEYRCSIRCNGDVRVRW